MKELYLLRGLPGSGKSTLAKSIGGSHFEADMYFIRDGKYSFDVSKLSNAHSWCSASVYGKMANGTPKIVVSNTFTKEWEMDNYNKMAEEHGYTVYSLIVENRHGGKGIHDVPEETIQNMEDRFSVKLR